ncbi:MAG: hypothetical protein WCG91_04095 [Candidatus Shapirobacteria bacterium]
MNNQTASDFLKGIKELGSETVEKAAEESGKIFESVITGRELLGDIKPMNEQELAQKKQEENKKKQQEMEQLKAEMGRGRNVSQEIEQISNEKKKKEEEEEKVFLENLKRKREEERQEEIMNSQMMESSPSHHKDKGGNPHKTQQPDPSQMSQTNEFKGGKID